MFLGFKPWICGSKPWICGFKPWFCGFKPWFKILNHGLFFKPWFNTISLRPENSASGNYFSILKK